MLVLSLEASSQFLGDSYLLVGSTRGKVVFEKEGNWEEMKRTVEISRESLPSGVIQFTLFNTQGMPHGRTFGLQLSG